MERERQKHVLCSLCCSRAASGRATFCCGRTFCRDCKGSRHCPICPEISPQYASAAAASSAAGDRAYGVNYPEGSVGRYARRLDTAMWQKRLLHEEVKPQEYRRAQHELAEDDTYPYQVQAVSHRTVDQPRKRAQPPMHPHTQQQAEEDRWLKHMDQQAEEQQGDEQESKEQQQVQEQYSYQGKQQQCLQVMEEQQQQVDTETQHQCLQVVEEQQQQADTEKQQQCLQATEEQQQQQQVDTEKQQHWVKVMEEQRKQYQLDKELAHAQMQLMNSQAMRQQLMQQNIVEEQELMCTRHAQQIVLLSRSFVDHAEDRGTWRRLRPNTALRLFMMSRIELWFHENVCSVDHNVKMRFVIMSRIMEETLYRIAKSCPEYRCESTLDNRLGPEACSQSAPRHVVDDIITRLRRARRAPHA
eukprot:TRINITY_DN19851_c0_g1_i1.p1 TRINITY_DN19851_c0_g1~~TRINITY_DN19851_c0_g1_i1.p1  ORF type:complete len:415 (+),score=101.00 TRINITY_DN19851_c0_g1_i1:138-1382(+)